MTTLTISDVLDIGDGFIRTVRTHTIDGVRHSSVLDVVRGITGGDAVNVWKRLKADHPEIQQQCVMHIFGGHGGAQPTPIATPSTIMEIIFNVPGKNAKKFRRCGATTFLKVLNPDEVFIDEMKTRLEQQATCADSTASPLINRSEDKVARFAPRAYDQTAFYVRARLPQEYLRNDLTNRKQFTLSLIKFGVAYSIQERNLTYMKDPDNGYMVYAFPMANRVDAEAVENVVKADFLDLTVLNSKEYLDAPRLAAVMGMTTYDPDAYADYQLLAQKLFAHLVRRAKLIWPDKYRSLNGCRYNIVERVTTSPQSVITSTGGLERPPLQVELSLPSILITDAEADEIGLTIPEGDTLLNRLLRRDVQRVEEIIGTDDAGVSVMYESVRAAGELAGIKSSSISNVKDTPKKYVGRVWTMATPAEYETFVECTP